MKVPFFDLGAFVREQKPAIMAGIERVVDSGIYIGGAEVERFESEFAASVGAKHCVAVGNGLDAIRLLLEAHDIGAGDEVIVPGFTFYATWLAVLQAGATPIAVDVKLEDASIDPDKIQSAISSKTRAILVVHLFGISVDMQAVNQIAKQNSLLVFEDCAQAHHGQTNAGPVGSSSDGAAFSFYPTKNLGALGDAGAITFENSNILQTLKSRRSYGVGLTKYEHVDTGWNSRLDPMQASVLLELLPGLESVTALRCKIAFEYTEALNGSAPQKLLPIDSELNVYHHFVVRTQSRFTTQKFLGDQGISTDIHYPYYFNTLEPIRSMYARRGLKLPELTNSATLSETVISLPIGPWMNLQQVDYVKNVLRNAPLGLGLT